MAKHKKTAGRLKSKRTDTTKPRLYTLEVFLIDGNITEKFAKKNPVVSRTIQIRGDQTLEDLHETIFDAFNRYDPHMYEFQFGKGPMDPKGRRYVLPGAFELDMDEENPPAGTTNATLDSLSLRKGSRFGYWFDFGDDWWHQIKVAAINDVVPRGKYPKLTNRLGESPPQYIQEGEEDQ